VASLITRGQAVSLKKCSGHGHTHTAMHGHATIKPATEQEEQNTLYMCVRERGASRQTAEGGGGREKRFF